MGWMTWLYMLDWTGAWDQSTADPACGTGPSKWPHPRHMGFALGWIWCMGSACAPEPACTPGPMFQIWPVDCLYHTHLAPTSERLSTTVLEFSDYKRFDDTAWGMLGC